MVNKESKKSKKGGMNQINPNATPMTNFDLANGYSTLQNGGKKRGRKSKKGGTMELNPSSNPVVNSDLAHGLSTLTGGKKKGRGKKKGGADPNLSGSSAFYNMNNMVPTATPYTMAEAPVAAANAPTPFSAGMPNYASVEYGLPTVMTNSLTGGLDQSVPVSGGGKKGRKSSGRKKKGGEFSIMDDINKIFERLESKEDKKEEDKKEDKEEVKGGKGKRGRKSKKGGGDTLAKLLSIQNGGAGEFSGASDWQAQIALDNNSNMPGGGKSKRKNKKK